MIKKISGCVSCGLSPCYHCEDYELTCDHCEQEVEALYRYNKEQVCEECFKELAFEDAEEIDYRRESEE